MNKPTIRSIPSAGRRLRPRRAGICFLLCAALVILLAACSQTGGQAPPTPAETHAGDSADLPGNAADSADLPGNAANPAGPQGSGNAGSGGAGSGSAGFDTSDAGSSISAEDRQEAAAQARTSFDGWSRRFLQEQLGDSFLNLHYSLISPEDYGITDFTPDFGSFSLTEMQNARSRQKEFRAELRQIDPTLLSEEQQLTYRILDEAFRLEESGDGLELYYQPLTPSTGVQAQLPILLAEFSFRKRQDIDDYLTLLSDIDDYYGQILEFEREKAAAGLFMTDACVDQIVEECAAYRLPSDRNFMTSMFDQRIDAFDGLTPEERTEYKEKNRAVIDGHFVPAYDLLLDGLTQLKGSSTNDQGLYYDPEGRRYYEYLVNSSIGTSYESIEALRDAISAQIDSDLQDMTEIIEKHPETADQIMDYSFAYTGPEQILTQLASQITEDFPECPECNYVTKYVPEELAHTLGPAFFLVPPIDDYDDCIIYINPDSTSDSQALYTTLAHEGIPGHMYQNTYFLSHCNDSLRRILSFTSYSEGWAFYVENYSYTTENGLSPELGSLLAHNAAASLGLHAIIDININYFGWTREQVKEFLAPYFDVSDESLVESVYNIMLSTPVNYLEYYVGYLEIIQMRDQAREALGSAFSLKDFHQFLLDEGPAPFTVIREDFQVWLLSQSLN